MEDKTIIALAAMIILSIMLLVPCIVLENSIEIKIGLATSVVAIVGSIVAYAYGVEKSTEKNGK